MLPATGRSPPHRESRLLLPFGTIFSAKEMDPESGKGSQNLSRGAHLQERGCKRHGLGDGKDPLRCMPFFYNFSTRSLPSFALYLSSDAEITASEVSIHFLLAVLTLRKVFHVGVCNFSLVGTNQFIRSLCS